MSTKQKLRDAIDQIEKNHYTNATDERSLSIILFDLKRKHNLYNF